MSSRRNQNKIINFVVGLLVIAFFAIVIYFQVQGAIQCSEDGGQYLRNWANWPVCVGGK